ncbi:MAG: hypothetical protein ACFB6S_17250 [Geminicoccaceae bacterium]
MGLGPLVDIALGLFLFYLVLSITVSGLQEWIAQLLALRATNLRSGIQNLLGNEHTQRFYEHSMIKSLGDQTGINRTWRGSLFKRNLPSYIPSKRFADALLDEIKLAKRDDQGLNVLEKGIDNALHPDLANNLKLLARRTDGSIEAFRAEIEGWFNDSMDRVSGWYTQRARTIGLVVALIVVVGMNADSLRLARALYLEDELRHMLASTAADVGDASGTENGQTDRTSEISPETIEQVLSNVPLGWSGDENFGPLSVIGWLITIAAVSLGAPFWFDLLRRVARLRSAGQAPGEKGPAS